MTADVVSVQADGRVVAEVQIGPADKLVLMHERAISDETAIRLRIMLDAALKGPERVIVLGDGLRLAVLHLEPAS